MNKSTIITDLQDMLSENLTGVKYIDKDWGQLSMEQPPVGWPCVLIDIESVEIQDLTDLHERAVATVVLTVANKRTNSSSAHATSTSKGKSTATLDLTDDVHLLVQNYAKAGAEYSPLQVVSFYKLNDLPGAEVYSMRYTTRYDIDLEAQPAEQPQPIEQPSNNN